MKKFNFSIRSIRDRETMEIIEAFAYSRKLEEILKRAYERKEKQAKDKPQGHR